MGVRDHASPIRRPSRAYPKGFFGARLRTEHQLEAESAAQREWSPFHARRLVVVRREMVACMCRQTDSLPVGIGRVQLPPGLADGVGGRAAKRRLCAVHTSHKRTPPVATFASERAEVKKSLFIFDERQRKLLRHRTAPAREPWGALGMVGMWAVAARRGT